MMELTQFERLEEKIEELVDTLSTAKRKNEELLAIIEEKDRDIHRLNNDLEAINQDRKRIGDRVEALLNKIENLGNL
jgi:FtsZ-binding cell division protein ZapB